MVSLESYGKRWPVSRYKGEVNKFSMTLALNGRAMKKWKLFVKKRKATKRIIRHWGNVKWRIFLSLY